MNFSCSTPPELEDLMNFITISPHFIRGYWRSIPFGIVFIPNWELLNNLAIKQSKHQAKVTYDNNLKYRAFYTTPNHKSILNLLVYQIDNPKITDLRCKIYDLGQ